MINIQEYQMKKKEDEIVNKALKSGSLVTTYDVVTKLNQFFQYKTAGLPYYKNLRLGFHSKSNKEEYNKSFKELGEDLDVAYTIYNNQEKTVLEAKNTFDSEVLELYREFDELSSEIELADMYNNKGLVYYPHIINFNNLEKINCKNLYDHNIPHTTCEVDYDKSIMRNELHSTPNDKVDLTKSLILVTTPSKNINITKDVKQLISENSTEVITVETRSLSDAPQTLNVDIALDKPYDISRVSFSCYNITNAQVVLFLSEDGENYLPREVQQGEKDLTWLFNKRTVRKLRVSIRKKSNDITEDTGSSCFFSLVNLSVYNDKYSPSGVFTSESIIFDESITDVVIYPTHTMPPKTDISYFIGYEDNNDDVEWYPIKPEIPLDLQLLYIEEMVLNYITSDIFGSWDFDRETGRKLFYIHDLPKYVSMNSVYLRAGHSQWLIERLDMTPKYGQSYPKDFRVNVNDYSKEYVQAIAPLDMSMTDIRCEKEWNYFVMSSYVVCSKETIVEDRFMTYDFTLDEEGKPQEVFDMALMVNGRRIFPKGNKYSFRLKEGENTIKMMILFGNQDLGTPAEPKVLKFISHNFNLLSHSDAVFAGPKMNRMSYNSLYRHISEKELKHYAIKEKDGRKLIVTKMDPNYVLNPNAPYSLKASSEGGGPPMYEPPKVHVNCSEYMRMYLKYKHMLPITKEKLTNSKGDDSIRCRVMARLSSSDISVSPTIKRIKVVGI